MFRCARGGRRPGQMGGAVRTESYDCGKPGSTIQLRSPTGTGSLYPSKGCLACWTAGGDRLPPALAPSKSARTRPRPAAVPTASLGCTTSALQVAVDLDTVLRCHKRRRGRGAARHRGTQWHHRGVTGPPFPRSWGAGCRPGGESFRSPGRAVDRRLGVLVPHRPWRLEVRAGHKFEAAIFYGEALEWTCARPGCCEVRCEHGGVALQDAGSVAARIPPAGTALSGEPTSPCWNVYFPVPNAAMAAEAASRYGGGTIGRAAEGDHRSALLYDPHGAVFDVESPRSFVTIARGGQGSHRRWFRSVPPIGRPDRAAWHTERGSMTAPPLPADRSIPKGSGNV